MSGDMVPVVCSGILDMYQGIVDMWCVRGHGTSSVFRDIRHVSRDSGHVMCQRTWDQ